MSLLGSTEEDVINKLDKYLEDLKSIDYKRGFLYTKKYAKKIADIASKSAYINYVMAHFYYKPIKYMIKKNKSLLAEEVEYERKRQKTIVVMGNMSKEEMKIIDEKSVAKDKIDRLEEIKSAGFTDRERISYVERIAKEFENAIKAWDKMICWGDKGRRGVTDNPNLTENQKNLLKNIILNYQDSPKDLHKKIKKVFKDEDMSQIFDMLLSNIIYHSQNFNKKVRDDFKEEVAGVTEKQKSNADKGIFTVAPFLPLGYVLASNPVTAPFGLAVIIIGGILGILRGKGKRERSDPGWAIRGIHDLTSSLKFMTLTLVKIVSIYELRKEGLLMRTPENNRPELKDKMDKIDEAFKFISKNLK